MAFVGTESPPLKQQNWGFVGVAANCPYQAPNAIFDDGDYQLAIIEFDDQGRCYDRAQMDSLAQLLDEASEDFIIVTFVHGWKHNASGNDGNLTDFRTKVLAQTAAKERSSTPADRKPRRVLGVFVGWRGLTLYDRFGWLANLTFWDRQEAARRVAVGSVRELFGRLRRFRDSRRTAGGTPMLVIVGHSFGGLIVFSAVAQALIEAAATPGDEVTPHFADLILLVNPALEAARYLPIYDLVQRRMAERRGSDQLPVFIEVTTTNDWATGKAFPLGNLGSYLSESWRGLQERQAMRATIGHLSWLTTHRLQEGDAAPGYSLTPVSPLTRWSPFWIVQTTKAIIDGHNGIFKNVFLSFVAEQLFRHVEQTKGRVTVAQTMASHSEQ